MQIISYFFGLMSGLVGLGYADSDGHLNVFGGDLDLCSKDPMTGYWRDGYCKTDQNDSGTHTVCAKMTDEFLTYTKSQGNDLSTARGSFPGLNAGDKWCLCAIRWREAEEAGKAPQLYLSASHEHTLKFVDEVTLEQYEIDE